MESGTVLHIALLKKLSNHYPRGQLCSRFYHFKRCSPAQTASRSPCQPARPSFEKYGRSSPFLGERGHKPRRGRQEKKFSRVLQGQPADALSGWNVENQQQVSYTEKLKRDQYLFFPHLLDGPGKPARSRFEKSRSQQAVLNASRLMNALETAPEKNTIQFRECKYSSAIHVRQEEKENEPQLEPLPATIRLKNRRVRSKDRSITASPLSRRPKRSLL